MSVGSLGIVGGLAGSSLAQTTGAAPERAKQDAAQFQRQVASTQQAADAAGIGLTNEDHHASDRDADGRQPWELPPAKAEQDASQEPDDQAGAKPKDPSGDAGTILDLTG